MKSPHSHLLKSNSHLFHWDCDPSMSGPNCGHRVGWEDQMLLKEETNPVEHSKIYLKVILVWKGTANRTNSTSQCNPSIPSLKWSELQKCEDNRTDPKFFCNVNGLWTNVVYPPGFRALQVMQEEGKEVPLSSLFEVLYLGCCYL
uniref:Uncharacterized protein n=1 Tax=Sphaerodactylus townsendi TaxID=933632 RepID=A0ACB8G0Y2_9SAUR